MYFIFLINYEGILKSNGLICSLDLHLEKDNELCKNTKASHRT